MELVEKVLSEAMEMVVGNRHSEAVTVLERLAVNSLNLLGMLYLEEDYRTDLSIKTF